MYTEIFAAYAGSCLFKNKNLATLLGLDSYKEELYIDNKNDAKRSRQHAGGKYQEYAQRSVCFVNNQVP